VSINFKKLSFNTTLFLFFGLIFLATFAIGAIVVTPSTSISTINGVNNTYNITQAVNFMFNISINNTNNGAGLTGMNSNITAVTIILPAGISFNNTFQNGTSSTGNVFSVYNVYPNSITLNWSNSTSGGYLINGSNISSYFWFNATPYYYGNYNITVIVWNYTGPEYGNITVNVNDTVQPNVTAINSPLNGANYSGTTLVLNASVNDSYVGSGISAVYFNITSTADTAT